MEIESGEGLNGGCCTGLIGFKKSLLQEAYRNKLKRQG